MPPRLSDLSIRELKERFADPGVRITPRVLAELEADPRRGAQLLHAALSRRRAEARAERRRIGAMLARERELWRAGTQRVAGVDEAGMSPLAGPVVAAAVVVPPGTVIEGVNDSKQIPAELRDELAAQIRERASGVGVGLADVADIDRHNIYWAGLLAMRRAIEALPEPPEHVLVDARRIPDVDLPQEARPKGDAHHFSIAAASIIAKTHRDALMDELDRRHPGYGLARHKGYPTAEHQRAIRTLGPCPSHRTSFPHFRELRGECTPTYYAISKSLAAAGDGELDDVAARLDAERDDLEADELRKLRAVLQRRRARARHRG